MAPEVRSVVAAVSQQLRVAARQRSHEVLLALVS
jgi:hypothetical protein